MGSLAFLDVLSFETLNTLSTKLDIWIYLLLKILKWKIGIVVNFFFF